jgi:hypothetical protein
MMFSLVHFDRKKPLSTSSATHKEDVLMLSAFTPDRKESMMKQQLSPTLLPLFRKHKLSMILGAYALATLTSFWLSGEAFATKIEDQLEAVHKLTTGGVVKTGMGVATIGGAVVAVMKQSPGLAAVVAGIGIAFSYYMGWLNKYDWSK